MLDSYRQTLCRLYHTFLRHRPFRLLTLDFRLPQGRGDQAGNFLGKSVVTTSNSVRTIITTQVTQAMLLKRREFLYFPIKSSRFTRRSMKIRTKGRRMPLATCESRMMGICLASLNSMTVSAPTPISVV